MEKTSRTQLLAWFGCSDFHDIFGLSIGHKKQDVVASYRKLALIHHPDKNPGNNDAADRFKFLKYAYDILIQNKEISKRLPMGEKKTAAKKRSIYICTICGSSYKHKGSLTRHQLEHNESSYFSCPRCTKKFTRKDNFRDHYDRVHKKN